MHEVLDLEPDHVTVLDGIPVATPTRTVFELAGSVHPQRAERALDSMWARNLTSRPLLDQMLDDWADRGRAGTVLMRELLEARAFGYVPPASNLEARFATLAERFCVGPFRRQVDLGGQAWIGRVDFLHAHCPLVVEVLSELYHAALVDQEADARRFDAARRRPASPSSPCGTTSCGVTPVPPWRASAEPRTVSAHRAA